MSAITILLIVSLILFILAAIPLPWTSPVQLGWLGMFFFVLTFLIK